VKKELSNNHFRTFTFYRYKNAGAVLYYPYFVARLIIFYDVMNAKTVGSLLQNRVSIHSQKTSLNHAFLYFRSANYTKPGQYVKCFHNPEKVSFITENLQVHYIVQYS
jgi:hypothetical protein